MIFVGVGRHNEIYPIRVEARPNEVNEILAGLARPPIYDDDLVRITTSKEVAVAQCYRVTAPAPITDGKKEDFIPW
jgi:hypothetical protein